MGHLLLVLALVGSLAGAPALPPGAPPGTTRTVTFAPLGVHRPGEDVPVSGQVTGAPTTLDLQLAGAGGPRPIASVRPALDGRFTATIPGALTADLAPDASTGFRRVLAVEADGVTGRAPLTLAAAAGVVLDAEFVSPVGWVKPGERYAFRLLVRNYDPEPADGGIVTVTAPDGARFAEGRRVTWQVGRLDAATDEGPAVATRIVEARAATLHEDPRIVWKSLSSTVRLQRPGTRPQTATTHGPKVIPPGTGYDSARYGARAFPVVPVDFADRGHQPASGGDQLWRTINDPVEPGSTVNLYDEMSYGQLVPRGTVPSTGIETATWDGEYSFTSNEIPPPNTCLGGVTLAGQEGSPLLPERIRDGWYQLPGTTAYYGSDAGGSNLTGVASAIDAGCGPTGKMVYDAAAIADPELDYNDFDTDKDGLVDFFMVVFVGCGGNGASQTPAINCPGHETEPPYDNVWPHSGTLEGEYLDAETGLTGYVTGDRLTDLAGRPLFYASESRQTTTTTDTGLPAFVRVGAYNVNPETAITHASVIAHEYGHSLGLPDYYSLAGPAAGAAESGLDAVDASGPDFYGRWNLMAADYAQHIDVVGRRELGWVVPRVLGPGETVVEGMVDSKVDTGRIDWVTPDGEPYTVEGDNGQAYAVALPAREVIAVAELEGASPTHVWWSGSGDNFGCTPSGGHNLDLALPQLAEVEPGTPVRLEFSSRWDIEWDFDYGFTMVSTDGGASYAALPSLQGFTTPRDQNPNTSACQARYGNGLTGTSGSYAAGSETLDRTLGTQTPGGGFLRDAYDLSAFAGQEGVVLRFSYATDVGQARPGWFIDDLAVSASDDVLYATDFEDARDPLVFNGGCREDLRTAEACTPGWQPIAAGEGDPADHLYLLELRDRTGFDADGNLESERGPITWQPGLTLGYTDEHEAIGNIAQADRPAQSLLDATPTPGASIEPEVSLDDAAFTAAAGRDRFSDAGDGHVDNYTDTDRPDGLWRFDFDCLDLEVLRMTAPGAGPLVADLRLTTGPGCAPFDYGVRATTIGG